MSKTVDVTFVSLKNVGPENVSPVGVIRFQTVNSINDEQIYDTEVPYDKEPGQPMHPSGVTYLAPGETLTYDITKRMTVKSFQNLMFSYDLTQGEDGIYQGSFNRLVKYSEIDEFTSIVCDMRVIENGLEPYEIWATYTVSLA